MNNLLLKGSLHRPIISGSTTGQRRFALHPSPGGFPTGANFIITCCFLPMRPLFLSLFLCLLALVPTPAQTTDPASSPLPRLLAERKVLTNRYAAARAQRHSLFGNKPSKKDLQEVVDALQGIVDQDEKIVAVLNRTAQTAQTAARHYSTAATQLQYTSRDDRNTTTERLAELQNDLANARQREKKLAERQREAEADLSEAQQGRFWRDGLIAALTIACVAMLFMRRRAAPKGR